MEEELKVENKLDPRQRLAWNNYIDQTKPTFGNGYRSALAAGYSDSYSKVVMSQPWFEDKLRRTHLLGHAEKVLDKALKVTTVNKDGYEDAALLRVQVDAAKHITKTLGKDEGYSEKTEVTGGNPVVFLPAELIKKFNLGQDELDSESNKEQGGTSQESGSPSGEENPSQ